MLGSCGAVASPPQSLVNPSMRQPLKQAAIHQRTPESGSKKTGAGKILRPASSTLKRYLGLPSTFQTDPLLSGFWFENSDFDNLLLCEMTCRMTTRMKCRRCASHLGMLSQPDWLHHISQLQVNPSLARRGQFGTQSLGLT